MISGLALEIDIHVPSSLLPPWIIDVHAMASAAKGRSRQARERLLQHLRKSYTTDQVPIEACTISCWWPPLYSKTVVNARVLAGLKQLVRP